MTVDKRVKKFELVAKSERGEGAVIELSLATRAARVRSQQPQKYPN